ncbi:MAG TPA: heparinase II/III family protein, partial [Gemmatimonadaceae bacterium]|nr:heparinase II/III family protein [Gemmatimonadaceae bacterium]
GGGHGHPDRLNVLLSDGTTRWLDDMGTGSYVDPSLHWYRSTLAHNAPLFDGYQQQRVDGELLFFEERDDIGWICARAMDLYPGVAAMRTLVVSEDYVLDELAWEAKKTTVMDLPLHIDADLDLIGTFRRDDHGLDDAFGVISDVSWRAILPCVAVPVVARDGARRLRGFLISSHRAVLYHAIAPGAPGKGPHPLLLVRALTSHDTAWVRIVWCWSDTIDYATFNPDASITVVRTDGTRDRLEVTNQGYRIERVTRDDRRVIDLAGLVQRPRSSSEARTVESSIQAHEIHLGSAVVFELGLEQYRRSEASWEEAGRPSARVGILRMPNELVIDVAIRKDGELTFVGADAVNVYDNESPDINGDGIQLYLYDASLASGWVLVPEVGGAEEGAVRARPIEGWDRPRPLRAVWYRTPDGYTLRVRIESSPLAPNERQFALGVVVNEKPAGRERRRGQLVLGGRPGEFVYLRGDREDLSQLVRFTIT